MEEPQERSLKSMMREGRSVLGYLFSLRDGQADAAVIDRTIRDGILFKGANLWMLMLAILIASIGLNVNSTAVIIGAMLISPLMGPIMGVGYGAGINDFTLIRASLKNLGIAAALGMITSTLYFLVTPLAEAQSELFARTTPTLWDVLIAMFGGLAGIIAATRQERTNVVPGVAIATALMPPLCTAGYGLATGSAHYFFGAFYLFSINCVFIAVATLLLVSYLHLPHKRFVSPEVETRVRRLVYLVVTVTMLPSIYLAYGFVESELFRSRANDFIHKEFAFENSYVAKQDIFPDKRLIEVSVIGDRIPDDTLVQLSGKLRNYGLPRARLVAHQSGMREMDVASLKTGLLKDILGTAQQTSEEKNQRIAELENQLAIYSRAQSLQQQTAKELSAQYPGVEQVILAVAPVWEADGTTPTNSLIIELLSTKRLSSADQQRIKSWLMTRMGVDNVRLVVTHISKRNPKLSAPEKPAAPQADKPSAAKPTAGKAGAANPPAIKPAATDPPARQPAKPAAT